MPPLDNGQITALPRRPFGLLSRCSRTEIRVFEIDPEPNDGLSITGQLRIINLEQVPRPRFATLSYHWGNFSTPKDTIECNGCSISVTKNCFAALKHLRAHLLKESLPIWIDAICIVQEDSDDKNDQLPIMGKIYSYAEKGYIWLGEGTSNTDNAMDYLTELGTIAEDFTGSLDFRTTFNYLSRRLMFAHHLFVINVGGFSVWNLLSSSMPVIVYDRWIKPLQRTCNKNGRDWLTITLTWGCTMIYSILFLTMDYRPSRSSLKIVVIIDLLWLITSFNNRFPLEGLKHILSCPWIERLWTLQEAVLARNSVVACGDKLLPWKTLVYATSNINGIDMYGLNEPLSSQLSLFKWMRLHRLWYLHQINHPTTAEYSRLHGMKSVLNGREIVKYHRLYTVLAVIYVYVYLAVPRLLVAELFPKLYTPLRQLTLWGQCVSGIQVWMKKSSGLTRSIGTNGTRPLHREDEFILLEIQERKSQKPEDQYFAILALIKDAEISDLSVNVEQDLNCVYHELSATLLKYTGSLIVLLFSSPKHCTGAPSWVVDWTATPRCWIRAQYNYGWFRLFERPRGPPRGKQPYIGASETSKPTWELHSNNQKLIVRGLVMGQVMFSSDHFKELNRFSSDADWLKNTMSFWITLRWLSDSERLETVLGICRFFETCSDLFSNGLIPNRWPRTICKYAKRKIEDVEQELRNDRNRYVLLSPSASEYQMAITKFLVEEGMILVVVQTSSGIALAGVAPVGVQKGDRIALIAGVSAPIVVREQASLDGFEVIGPAFLPKVMNGELWDESLSRDIILV